MIHELHYSRAKQKITSCGLYWRECGLRKKSEAIEDEHQDTDPSNLIQKGTKVLRKTSRAAKNDIIEGVCYNPLDQEEEADEAYGQTGGATHSQALGLMVSHHDVCWGDNMAGYKWSGRLLEHINNFHLQVRAEPMRRGSLLDQIHPKEGLVQNVKIKQLCLQWPWWSWGLGKHKEEWEESSQPLPSEELTLASSMICSKESHGIRPWRKKDPRKPVNIYGSPPHKKNKQKKAYKRWKEGQVGLGRIQKHCLSTQEWSEESQSPNGISAVQGCQTQQKGLL